MGFSIRDALPSDAQSILDMIKELAEYEKTPSTEVQVTSQDLIEDGLKNGSYFKCFIAEVDSSDATNKKPVGYGLYYFGYSTWKGRRLYLEDIYVKPDYRGIGIGTAFFKRLAQIALEMGCCQVVFTCLDWNLPSKEFYRRIGAEEQPEWRLFYFKNHKMQDFLSRFT